MADDKYFSLRQISLTDLGDEHDSLLDKVSRGDTGEPPLGISLRSYSWSISETGINLRIPIYELGKGLKENTG